MNRQGKKKSPQAGVTILELLIAVAILAVILTLAVPGFSELGDRTRLVGAAEQVYGHLQQARSESVSRSVNTFVNFDVDGSIDWEYGVSSVNSLCDLTVIVPTDPDACVMVVDDGDGNVDPGDGSVDAADLVLMRFTGTDHGSVSMNRSGFSSGNTQIVFDPVRGTATSGQIDLAGAGGKLLRVKVSLLGRVTICSPDGSVLNYSTTGC